MKRIFLNSLKWAGILTISIIILQIIVILFLHYVRPFIKKIINLLFVNYPLSEVFAVILIIFMVLFIIFFIGHLITDNDYPF